MSSANGKAAEATVAALFKPPAPPRDFGVHRGHAVHPHDHQWQDSDSFHCSARFLCTTCTDKDLLPRGTWFWGPQCPRPAKTAVKGVAS